MPVVTHLTPDGVPSGSATDRLVSMLTDPSTEPVMLTREQLAYLMSRAFQWGYDTREVEENHEWAAHQARPPVRVLGRWFEQAAYRAQCDIQARLPRDNDFQGGLPIPPAYMSKETAA